MKTKNDKTEIVTSSEQIPSGYVPMSTFSTKESSCIHRRRAKGLVRAVKVANTVADFMHAPIFVHEGDAREALQSVRVWKRKRRGGVGEELPADTGKGVNLIRLNGAYLPLLRRIADALEKLTTTGHPVNPSKEDPEQSKFPFAVSS